jgi:hypothetical protein
MELSSLGVCQGNLSTIDTEVDSSIAYPPLQSRAFYDVRVGAPMKTSLVAVVVVSLVVRG